MLAVLIKIVNGFIIAVVTALGYLIAVSVTETTIRSQKINEQGQIAIDNQEYEYFLPVRYYNETPLYNFSVSENGYDLEIMVYNVAYIKADKTEESIEYNVYEGISLIILNDHKHFQYFAEAKLILESGKEIVYNLTRVDKLPVYIIIENESNSNVILKDLFQTEESEYDPMVSVDIYEDIEKDPILEIDFDHISEDTFTLETPLKNYLLESNNEAPVESFDNVSVTPAFVISTVGPVLLVSAIYFLIVGVLIFLLVTYRKHRNLGKESPTKALEKDIDKIKFMK